MPQKIASAKAGHIADTRTESSAQTRDDFEGNQFDYLVLGKDSMRSARPVRERCDGDIVQRLRSSRIRVNQLPRRGGRGLCGLFGTEPGWGIPGQRGEAAVTLAAASSPRWFVSPNRPEA